MQDTKTLHEKYVELIEAGYITPLDYAKSLEMPTAFIYVPTYVSDKTETLPKLNLWLRLVTERHTLVRGLAPRGGLAKMPPFPEELGRPR